MHVLILPSWYPVNSSDIGGSFFREQALALKKSGCEVGVIALHTHSITKLSTALRYDSNAVFEDDDGLKTCRRHCINWFPKIPSAHRYRWVRLCMQMYDLYIERYGKPDVIHVHAILNAGLVAKKIHQRDGVPYLITEHSSAFARGLLTSTQIHLAADVANDASRRFAVSSPFAKMLAGRFNQELSLWEVMPNIVEQTFLDWPLPTHRDDGFTFLSVSLLTENKRIDLLLRAFAQKFKGERGVRLRIGGDGPVREKLVSLTTELAINDQVEFLGLLSRDEVLQNMARSDALVVGSDYETFGVVVVEALALGKPVISTRCGGPDDILDEANGILVRTGNIDEMASAMVELVRQRQIFDPHSIRASCFSRFSEQAVAKRLNQAYLEVTSGVI